MYIDLQRKSSRGFTLVEFLVASATFGIATFAVLTMYLFSTRSFAALVNYAELDKINRAAMDTLTREIRQSRQVTDITTNSAGMIKTLYLINGDGKSVTYDFDPAGGQLRRCVENANGTDDCTTLLSFCKVLQFNVYQRTGKEGTFDQYDPAVGDSVQVVSLTWQASRNIRGSGIANSENIQTARVVIRNQHQFE